MMTRRELRARLEGFSTLFASLLSLSCVALAVAVRWLLDPWLGDNLPLVTLYGAVAAAVWIGGYSQGVVAAIVGYLACDYFFIAPRGVFGFSGHFVVRRGADLRSHLRASSSDWGTPHTRHDTRRMDTASCCERRSPASATPS